MLFRKDIEPRCAYCRHAAETGGEQLLCKRRGPVAPQSSCRRFRYDPLKRVPSPHPVLRTDGTGPEDFAL